MATSPKRRILHLMATVEDDRQLLRELEAYQEEIDWWSFGNSVGAWGRALYHRNPELFGPLVERHATVWTLSGTSGLEEWLQETKQNRHIGLFRILYQIWLQDTVGWEGQRERWFQDLRRAFVDADDRAQRHDVLDRFDLRFEIEDDEALELYEVDPEVTQDWIRDRIERTEWLSVSYEKLAEAAREKGDDDFFYYLYSHTFPLHRWMEDVKRLARDISDPDALNRELARRHFQGSDASVDPAGLVHLVKERGDDVLPYLQGYVAKCRTWGSNQAWIELVRLAAEREWWDVWKTVIRNHYRWPEFNELVRYWVTTDSEPHWKGAALMAKIAGARSGWGQWSSPIHLEEDVALAFYERFPELARGPFFDHFVVNIKRAYQAVAERADDRGDTAMIDLLASRAVTVAVWGWTRGDLDHLEWYVEHYRGLDGEQFAQRAFEVVSHVQPLPFMGRSAIRRTNPLYRLFYRNVERYRPVARRVRTLLESECEPTRRLGLQLLVVDGVPTAELAHQNTDHLLAYLLNQATRSTRIAAFQALASAADTDEDLAARICSRARETLDLRTREYPRDRLIELIGRIVHRWPALRTEREQPVIYEREAS